MNAVLQPDELRELRLVHKALADVNRLRIVQRLAAGPASVAELVSEVGLSQPLVSWHVGRLRGAGLVATRRIGRETVCSVRPEAFEAFAARQRAVLGLGALLDGEAVDAAPAGRTVPGAARSAAS